MTRLAEPEWDQATRDLALALDAAKIEHLCPICGREKSVCQSAELQDDWDVPPPTRCHATTAVRQHQKRLNEDTNPYQDALVWSTRLREKHR